MNPNKNDNSSYEFRGDGVFYQDGRFYVTCVSGVRGDNKMAYFTVYNDGNDDLDGEVTIGLPYHFLPRTHFGDRDIFTQYNSARYARVVEPPYYLSKSGTALLR